MREENDEGGWGGGENCERLKEQDEHEPHALTVDATAGVEKDDAVVVDGDGEGGGVVRFPITLHALLTRGGGVADGEAVDYDGGRDGRRDRALEWLPHGRGFRVLRWDELCAGVLPVEFPGLCKRLRDGTTITTRTTMDHDEGNGDGEDVTKEAADEGNQTDGMEDGVDDSLRQKKRGGYSDDEWIYSFLWHLRSWGFQEVSAGVDRGSFRHEVRFDEVLIFRFTLTLESILTNLCSPLLLVFCETITRTLHEDENDA